MAKIYKILRVVFVHCYQTCLMSQVSHFVHSLIIYFMQLRNADNYSVYFLPSIYRSLFRAKKQRKPKH